MKKTIYITITIIIMICIGLGNSAVAEETSFLSSIFKPHFKNDEFSASVGVKAWRAKYNGFNNTKLAYIPTLNFRYKNFSVSSSFFGKEGYTTYNYYNRNNIYTNTSTKRERSEWDINLGYYISRYLVITTGYKSIDQVDDINTNTFYSINGKNYSKEKNNIEERNIKGFIIGISGITPIKWQFGMYGNFAFGWMSKDELWSDDLEYNLGELGLIYSFSKLDNIHVLESASIYMGYRFQELGDELSDANEIISGFVFGVNLHF